MRWLVRSLEDARRAVSRSGKRVLFVRLQDSALYGGGLWLGDLMREAGIDFYGAAERAAVMVAEGITAPGDYSEHLAQAGLFDMPLRLPADLLAKRGPFCVVVPAWLLWDEHAAEAAGCDIVKVLPAEQFPADVVCHSAANLADQTRRVEPFPAVITPACGDSFLFLSHRRSGPPSRTLLRRGPSREHLQLLARFGLPEQKWRAWALLLSRQQAVDWHPHQPFVTPAEDAPLKEQEKVAVCGLVEGEGRGEHAVRIAGLTATKEVHLFCYREREGKPAFADTAYLVRCTAEEEKQETKTEILQDEEVFKAKIELKFEALSPSALESYLWCPRRFLFERMGLEQPESAGTLLGNLIHKILELHHRGRLGDPSDVARRFLKHHAITELERQLILRDALKLYKRYLTSGEGQIGTPVLLEEKFKIDVFGVPFVCKIDRVDRVDDGFFVIDYKRRGEKKQGALLGLFSRGWQVGKKSDYQVPLYIEALRQEGFLPIKGFIFIFLDFKNRGCVEVVPLLWERIEPHLEKALLDAAELGRTILADTRFLPPENPPCLRHTCPFSHLCSTF